MSWKSGVVVSHVGERFGKLVILETFQRQQPSGRNVRYCRCKCDCGNEKVISFEHLRNRHTTSCGCVQKNKVRERFTTHNQSNTRLYRIYAGIKNRCYNVNEPKYKYYGGRGIVLCKEWESDFLSFKKWAEQNGYDKNAPKMRCTIDRIDVNGNYEPANCRWVDQETQCKNKRNNIKISYMGKTKTLIEWARLYNLNDKMVYRRYELGWEFERIINTPPRKKKKTNES